MVALDLIPFPGPPDDHDEAFPTTLFNTYNKFISG